MARSIVIGGALPTVRGGIAGRTSGWPAPSGLLQHHLSDDHGDTSYFPLVSGNAAVRIQFSVSSHPGRDANHANK